MKKLRRKIVLAVFASTMLVFLLAMLAVGYALQTQTNNRADSMTQLICSNGGEFPEKDEYNKMKDENRYLKQFDEESPYRLRYFVVHFQGDSESVKSVNIEHIASEDIKSAETLARFVKDSPISTGYYMGYRYRVSDDKQMVVFLDIESELDTIRSIMLYMLGIALVFVLTITVLFYFLSKRIVRAFEENARMQKQFITDASHELKTPVAIISANAEVLVYKDGENEWLNNITEQTTRLSDLINELLTLNRLDEIETIMDIEAVDLSAVVDNACSDFEEVFSSRNVKLTREIELDVVLNGNQNQLERLVSVLVENASKYATDDGEVKVALKKEGRYTHLDVYNTCEIDPDVDYKHLFDRFYRPDSSRTSSTGGHGIGLSIAKRIAVLHNGSITAVPEENGLMFRVKLSNRIKPAKNKK